MCGAVCHWVAVGSPHHLNQSAVTPLPYRAVTGRGAPGSAARPARAGGAGQGCATQLILRFVVDVGRTEVANGVLTLLSARTAVCAESSKPDAKLALPCLHARSISWTGCRQSTLAR